MTGPALPDRGARTPLARALLSLFVVWHVVGMGASLGKKTPVGKAIREVTGPYEKLLGVWQSWGMFGPNPPFGTSWLKVEGTTSTGRVVELPALVGEKDFDRIDWTYSRIQKVERNMFDKSKQSLRASYGRMLCREFTGEAAAGQPPERLVEVRIRKDRTMTPKPGQRDQVPEVVVVPLQTVTCPEPEPDPDPHTAPQPAPQP